MFIVRHDGQWTKPLIIRQDYLLNHFQNDNIGSEHEGALNLYFSYSPDGKVICKGLDLSKYVSDFSDFPLIDE